jgi:uncharacterized RDD family membrane protein YckC
MVSTPHDAVAEPPVSSAADAPSTRPFAHVNARVSGYLVDSIVLLAFILVFFVIGGFLLLATSDWGEGDPPDAAYYAMVSVFLGGTLVAWTVFNIALMALRGQSTGMYVVGIKTERAGGQPMTLGRSTLRWFALNPLLFHPLLLPVWGVILLLLVSLTISQISMIVAVAMMVLCIVAPLAAIVSLLIDPGRRCLHDRLAGTAVTHMAQS